ncbi:hypothetical protein AB0G85_38220 [Streptomyces sioyaensis]|uniref:hypothetical protein n=1 Tax=Streptomyces sioyaensis TaxID=67364 RepID=UPI0033DEDAEF
MTDQTPRAHASAAADAIRQLNHETREDREGWQYPGDAYSLVGGLAQLANSLPQVLDQIAQLIERLAVNDHIRSDEGGDGAAKVHEALRGLEWASADAESLASRLGTVRSALSSLAYKE